MGGYVSLVARHLTQITAPLKEYLTSKYSKQWRLAKSTNIADGKSLASVPPNCIYLSQPITFHFATIIRS